MLTSNGNETTDSPTPRPPHGAKASSVDGQNPSSAPSAPRDDSYASHALGKIRDALHGLRYGVVTVVVQDGVVVQVERTEKLRLTRR